jgi:hypothetical protein
LDAQNKQTAYTQCLQAKGYRCNKVILEAWFHNRVAVTQTLILAHLILKRLNSSREKSHVHPDFFSNTAIQIEQGIYMQYEIQWSTYCKP